MNEEKGKVIPIKTPEAASAPPTKQVQVEALNDTLFKELKAKKLQRLIGLVNGRRVSLELQEAGKSALLNNIQYVYDSGEGMWFAVARFLDVYTITTPVQALSTPEVLDEIPPATPPVESKDGDIVRMTKEELDKYEKEQKEKLKEKQRV